MSAHRDLTVAQQRLNEAVERWHRVQGASVLLTGEEDSAFHGLMDAWDAFDVVRRDLDGDRAASGRRTSIATAKTALPLAGSTRRRVLESVCAQWRMYGIGMTGSELEGRLRKSHQTVSSAVNYLEARGWLKDSGRTKPTSLNRPAIVFVPSDLALRQIAEAATPHPREG